jgi:xanthine dehydrogenase small subunit
MRKSILFYVNGQRFEIGGAAVFAALSDFLRNDLQRTGTKVVCAEGDCGACTVLVGRLDGETLRYETVDSCIQLLYQLDGTHVVTVEGLQNDGILHPVQQAIIEHHGSQCGYCTPGFVMALAGLLEANGSCDSNGLRLGLSGNLCRCTGYVSILDAGAALAGGPVPSLTEQFATAAIVADLRSHGREPVLIECSWRSPSGAVTPRMFFAPRGLDEALDFKARHPEAVIVAGATELGVLRNKQGVEPPELLSLAQVPGLAEIAHAEERLSIGANVRWTELEHFVRDLWPEFYRLIIRFGSPQIRNVATLAGNVANGSPIADALPLLYVMEAEVELLSRRGSRHVKVPDFYRGYKRNDLAPDEIIGGIHLPLPAPAELLKLYKVSRRNDLDIATFGAAIRVERAGDTIRRARLAYAGVAPTVVRLPATEAFLQGQPFTEGTFLEAGRRASAEIQPISDVRGSRDFRWLLAENILAKFYGDCMDAACPAAARS